MQMQPESDASHDMHEADIGSGEKPLSQQDTEKMIKQVPANLPSPAPAPSPTTSASSASPPATSSVGGA